MTRATFAASLLFLSASLAQADIQVGPRVSAPGVTPTPTPTATPTAKPTATATPPGYSFKIGVVSKTGYPPEPPYGESSFGLRPQISAIEGLGMQIMRSVHTGNHTNFTAGGNVDTAVAAYRAAGINPVILINAWPIGPLVINGETYTNPTLQQRYDNGYRVGYATANLLKKYSNATMPRYYELGNEFDLRVGKISTVTNGGRTAADYDDDAFNIVFQTVRGMLDGVRKADPAGVVIVGQSGGTHMGYMLKLKQWFTNAEDRGEYDINGDQYAVVPWDISNFHWYGKSDPATCSDGTPEDCTPATDFGGNDHYNIFDYLKDNFGKPIVCTEFGYTGELYNYGKTEADQNKMAAWIVNCVTKWKAIAHLYDFRWATFYQLLDQPNKGAGGDETANNGRVSGLLSAPGSFYLGDQPIGTDKPSAIALRNWITANP